ncbi:MAG TPA: hypothetical protein VIM44_04195 [Rariglobus sp.]
MFDMTRSFRLLLVCSAAFAMGSCAPARWNDAQRASLTSLAVAPAIPAHAYGTPLGSDNIQAPVMVAGGGSFASGAAAGAGAQLVVEIGAVVQQKMFESRYADAIAKAPGTVPADLSSRIRQSVGKSLSAQPFFKGRIRDNSPNRLYVIVENYRYVRSGKENGEVLVTPSFYGRFELTNAAGEKLLAQPFAAGAPNYRRPLPDFARDKQLATKAFDEAIEGIARQAVNAVNAKLGEQALATTESPAAAPKPGGKPVQLQPVSGITATCNEPYKLTQSCNLFSGPSRSITVGGQKLKIAGSADGRVILIRSASLLDLNVTTSGSPQYDAVRQALNRSNLHILRQRDMVTSGSPVGFFLELDGDGYSVLTQS